MVTWLIRLALALAIAFLALTFFNASWLAGAPPGRLKLLAHRGVHQYLDPAGADASGCNVALAGEPAHSFLEDTIPAFRQATAQRADWFDVEIAETKDGELVIWPDEPLDCRTDGSGRIADHTLAELNRLDFGYGYTLGDAHPLRGAGIGQIATVQTLVDALPAAHILFRFNASDPEQAEKLAAVLERPGRDIAEYYGFYGDPAPVERIGSLVPGAWAFTRASAERCTRDYIRSGWYGKVPDSCRNGTIVIPLNRQWLIWGWPNRLLARIAADNVHPIVTGPYADGDIAGPLTDAQQFTRVPASYTGFVWIDDIWNMGPALRG